jgi:PA14 domain-containing protein
MKWFTIFALAIPGVAAQDPQEQTPFGEDVLVVQETLKPGLVGKYYNFSKELKKFPADLLVGQTPQLRRLDAQVNFESKDGIGFGALQWKEYFAVIWTGVLRVPKDGSYTLYLKSDDGSKLFLDGKELIDNDGKHRMDEDSKKVDLTSGDHELKIEYFQNNDKAGCVLSWKTEGIEKEVVPATAFWHKFEKDVDREAK